jgi:hypothetical protein
MSEHREDSARTGTKQDPRRFITVERLTQAEKTNAIRSLQRAARRCAKHLGRGATAVLLDIVRAELGGGQ